MYMYLYMNMYLYLYLNMNMYMYMIMYLYMSALARRSPPATQKPRLKKCIGLFKKRLTVFYTKISAIINPVCAVATFAAIQEGYFIIQN